MLTNFKKIIQKAYDKGYAIPAFNVDNYEIMKSIVSACEEKKWPVILMFTQSAIKYYGLQNLIDVASNLADNTKIPVVTHLDHESKIENCKLAIDAGITSIMYDGSHHSIEKNIENTNKVSRYFNSLSKDISLEAELGQIAGVEDWKNIDKVIYTNPKEAKNFFENTSIDCLAVSIGTAHGIYKSKPKLNIGLLKEINDLLKKPLVLHGGSGLQKEVIKECIKHGVAKINFGTEIKQIFAKSCIEYAIENRECKDVRQILQYAMEKLKILIFEKIEICKG